MGNRLGVYTAPWLPGLSGAVGFLAECVTDRGMVHCGLTFNNSIVESLVSLKVKDAMGRIFKERTRLRTLGPVKSPGEDLGASGSIVQTRRNA